MYTKCSVDRAPLKVPRKFSAVLYHKSRKENTFPEILFHPESQQSMFFIFGHFYWACFQDENKHLFMKPNSGDSDSTNFG